MGKPTGPTNIEVFTFYCEHLDNPCGVVVDGKRHDIRPFWEKLTMEALPRITNPHLRSLLERKIRGCF